MEAFTLKQLALASMMISQERLREIWQKHTGDYDQAWSIAYWFKNEKGGNLFSALDSYGPGHDYLPIWSKVIADIVA